VAEIGPVRQRRARRRVLTDKMVSELPRKAEPYFYPDPELPKHGIRVRPTGPGAYTVITRDPFKRQRWTKIGSTAEMTIAAARAAAREVISRVERGDTPFPPVPVRADSVGAVAEGWLQRHVAKSKLRTARELRRIITKYILPHWAERDFVSIKRADIAKLLDYVEDEHGPAMADSVLTVLRSLSTWVQSRDDNYVPPFVRGMQRVPAQARKRSRTLADHEIKAVWDAAENAGAFGAFVRLLLLTAQRKDKICTLQWSDISRDGVWTIRTSAREKNNAGSLSLPKAALSIVHAQPRFTGSPYVFAGRGGRHKAFGHFYKAAFDKACGVSDWRLHDLRRTSRSLMSRAGVQSEHAERVLGHAIGCVEEIYNRHTPMTLKKPTPCASSRP